MKILRQNSILQKIKKISKKFKKAIDKSKIFAIMIIVIITDKDGERK